MKEVKGINQARVDEVTIANLEVLLASAKSGELTSILYVDKYQDGKVGYGWEGEVNRQMVGAMEELKFDVFSQILLTPVEV